MNFWYECPDMLTGVDLLSTSQASALRRRLRNARVGVLTHACAIDRRGRRTIDVLEELGAKTTVLFTPEHGFDGLAQAEEPVPGKDSGGDEQLPGRLPVVSLYGSTKASLSPDPNDLAGRIDLLLIDLVEVGSRFYTYVWSALLAIRAAAAAGVHSVVLDRPNPLSGAPETIEGRPQEPEFTSFVGLEPIPIRHALTLGEVVTLFAERDGLALGAGGALGVVAVAGWERHRTAAAWGRPFAFPSPNMPTLETAFVYPGACLVEGTNLSEGRGTTLPFQIVGAPFLDGEQLAESLAELGAPGALVRPIRFRPMFGKHAQQICSGVMVHVTEPLLFRPVAVYTALIALARAQRPDQFAFIDRPYEFETDRLAFDLLSGSAAPRLAMLEDARVNDVVALLSPVDPVWREITGEAESRLARAAE